MLLCLCESFVFSGCPRRPGTTKDVYVYLLKCMVWHSYAVGKRQRSTCLEVVNLVRHIGTWAYRKVIASSNPFEGIRSTFIVQNYPGPSRTLSIRQRTRFKLLISRMVHCV